MAGVAAGPISGRIVDRIHPWHAILISTLLLLMFQAIQTAAGGLHIAAVIVSCFGLDFLQQIQSIGLVMSFFR
jgi:predicted MFS family arabinose efflux permease